MCERWPMDYKIKYLIQLLWCKRWWNINFWLKFVTVFKKSRNIQGIKPNVNILSSCPHQTMWGIFSFLFYCYIQICFQMSTFLRFSWIKNSSQKLYFLQMYDDNNWRTIEWFLPISWLKNHWEEKYFHNFLVSRNVFKKGYLCQFLVSKI